MSEKLFLSDLLVDKKYIPSAEEMTLLVAKINFPEKLKNTSVVESPSPTLIFDSLEHSRLFLAKLGAPISSSFFEPIPLTEIFFKDLFAASETYHASGIELKFVELGNEGMLYLKGIIRETMPDLANKLKKFT